MATAGYYGKLLEVDLTSGTTKITTIPDDDIRKFIGGRGLGAKILWERVKAGTDPLSPENVLMFMPGMFSGLPIPSSSRTCVVTKSPRTTAFDPKYKHSSTISYSNMGGFFGPELRFAGYDGLLVTGKSKNPVYIKIQNDKVTIEDGSRYWGMGTDKFDKIFHKEVGDGRWESCYIGPAGESLIPMASVLNTAARAAGRGGTGCVMGSKNLKAVVVQGNKMPNIANLEKYNELLEKVRRSFMEKDAGVVSWRYAGTASALEYSSNSGTQAVKNYGEGTFGEIKKIGTEANRKAIWKRDFACFSCQLACKKSGYAKGAYNTLVHDGPEYETGTMLGANLMISDISGLQKLIYVADDYGIDIISVGNTIGFLMEAYEKGDVDRNFLDGIDLTWGSVDASLEMLHKICKREGIGELACNGTRSLAEHIGKNTSDYAINVKGHELAAWNIPVNSDSWAICYATANRGACHMNGGSAGRQDGACMNDSLAACSFAGSWYTGDLKYQNFMTAITGHKWTDEEFSKAGERIFTLEKMFNYRDGFRREDDSIPEKFFNHKFTFGDHAGAIVDRDKFNENIDKYYEDRGWDLESSKPTIETLKSLDLDFTI